MDVDEQSNGSVDAEDFIIEEGDELVEDLAIDENNEENELTDENDENDEDMVVEMAYSIFQQHTDAVFCVAVHPLVTGIVATGSDPS